MIKLKRILHEAGIISEQDESFEFEFNSGEATLSRPGNVKLSQLIARVNNMIKRGSRLKSIKISASESKVPNQPPYEKEGSLAKARAENLAAILKKEFPNIEVKVTYQPKAQGPEFDAEAGDQADDPKYKEHQYVKAQLELEPTEERVPYSLIDLVYAIPTAEYTRMQGPEGSNTGTIKVYSTGRVNTAGTMTKSAAEYKMKKQFKGLSELQSIVSRVATKGTGFEDGDTRRGGPLPMAPTIVDKAKQLLTVLESLSTATETWIVQNPQQAAELAGVSKPTSIRSDLYAGEIRGFDNLTKFFTAVKNKV